MAPLTPAELLYGFKVVVKLFQRSDFTSESKLLQRGHCVPKSSPVHTFDPFLDSLGIVRVGERLRYLILPNEEKHPVILHGKSALAYLVMGWAHEQSVHGGSRLTDYRAI